MILAKPYASMCSLQAGQLGPTDIYRSGFLSAVQVVMQKQDRNYTLWAFVTVRHDAGAVDVLCKFPSHGQLGILAPGPHQPS